MCITYGVICVQDCKFTNKTFYKIDRSKFVLFMPFLTLFDLGFFEPSPSVMEGGGGAGGGMIVPNHNFVVIAPMILKFGTAMKLEVFYTMAPKNLYRFYYCVSLYVITCILAQS